MDPQVAWDQMLRAVTCEDWPEAGELATALSEWLDRDGFPPTVIINPPIGNPLNARLASCACEFVLAEALAHGWTP